MCPGGYYNREPEVEDPQLIKADLGPNCLAMVRHYTIAGEKAKLPFVLRCARCDCEVNYTYNKDTPPGENYWCCTGCTAPANIIFKDFQMKNLPLVRFQQVFYISKTFSGKEEVYKLCNDGQGPRTTYTYSRKMTVDELGEWHLRVIENQVAAFAKGLSA